MELRLISTGADPFLYVNTYVPLVATPAGIEAAKKFNIPPFVDGSIRREPDLEHAFPSISCICRGGNFAPRLRRGDVVVYMTTKGRYGAAIRAWRLTAILRVRCAFNSHDDAQVWYEMQGLPLPSNCMVSGNPSLPVSHSHRKNRSERHPDAERFRRAWDAAYATRVREHPAFVVCDPLFVDVGANAPVVRDEDLDAVFGKAVATRNPGKQPVECLGRLADRLKIKLRG